VSNYILLRVDNYCKKETIIVRMKVNWIGHMMRREGLLREVMESRMKGKRSRGRTLIMGMLV